MDRMDAEDFSLFGLLGRSWQLDAPVVDLAFDNSHGAVAFALADGSVAIAKTKDREPASSRIRISAEDGRASILPRTKPLPPITRISVQERMPVALTAYGRHGFVIGDASGALTSLTIGGERTPFSQKLPAAITAIGNTPETATIACATEDNHVHLLRSPKAEPEVLNHDSPIATLAFSPNGYHLAVACEDRITHWKISKTCKELSTLTPCQDPVSLAYSPDQSKIAIGQQAGGVTVWHLDQSPPTPLSLPDYPAPVRSVAWSDEGETLITSGAFRIIAWSFNSLKPNGLSPQSLDTGRPGLAAVETITRHPNRPLIAAGYENGMLIIAQIGKADELVIKTEGHGSISSAKWSRDAGSIAIGSRQGLAAIVELPPQIFR